MTSPFGKEGELLKTCTKCGKIQPISEFTKHSQAKDGLSSWCKKCCVERSRVFRRTPSGIYTTFKARETFYKNKPVKISREEFIEWYNDEPKVCAYCGIPEEYAYLMKEKYHGLTDRLSIDCKDNDAGYLKGNLALCCDRCNFSKSNVFTYEEMKEIGEKYVRPKWEELVKELNCEEASG